MKHNDANGNKTENFLQSVSLSSITSKFDYKCILVEQTIAGTFEVFLIIELCKNLVYRMRDQAQSWKICLSRSKYRNDYAFLYKDVICFYEHKMTNEWSSVCFNWSMSHDKQVCLKIACPYCCDNYFWQVLTFQLFSRGPILHMIFLEVLVVKSNHFFHIYDDANKDPKVVDNNLKL